MDYIFLIIGLVVGFIAAWFIAKQTAKNNTVKKEEYDTLQQAFADIKSKAEVEAANNIRMTSELEKVNKTVADKENELRKFTGQLASLGTELETIRASEKVLSAKQTENQAKIEVLRNEKGSIEKKQAQLEVAKDGIEKELNLSIEKLTKLEDQLDVKTDAFNKANQQVATLSANNRALEENQKKQQEELQKLNEKFNKEFENIANKILEEKTEKFTTSNKTNIEALLKPLGENIDKFKQKVDDVYNKESKERFSLGEKVRELVGLNEKLSKEAHNLTHALKADHKAQGNWGEMILESILEQSGLTKDREYFLENYLKDDKGNYLISEDGKKMRPDAIVQYPDNRRVIVDSKVSLNAYTNYMQEDDMAKQQAYLKQHVEDVKRHIVGLSKRGYENFDKSLDFVMMFIPNEPAYMVAIKEEPGLWNFAYDKRIILISPTNLIASLKLISNLWSREHQSRNAQAIVSRGEKLYAKFVNFADNFKKVGKGIETAQGAYSEAFKQLSTGNDNLILQAVKLKELKIEPKKDFSPEFLEGNQLEEGDE